MILSIAKQVFTLVLLVFSIPTLAQALVAASASVQLTDMGDGLRWVDSFGYNATTGRVFFAGQPSSSTSAPPQKLYEVSVEGGPIVDRSLQSDTVRDSVLQWFFSPDGNQIVYRVRDSHRNQSDLFVIDTVAGPPRQLTFTGSVHSRAQYMSSGDRVVYLSKLSPASSPNGLYSLATDGSEVPMLLSASPNNASSSLYWELSRDSLQVFYLGITPTDSAHIYRVDTMGGPAVQLTEHPIARLTRGGPQYRFDATAGRFAYLADPDEDDRLSFFTRGPEHGSEVELTLSGDGINPDEAFDIYGFAGSRVVFRYRNERDWPEQLFIADPATGVVSTISDSNDQSTFYSMIDVSPQGESVFFSETISQNPTENGVFQYDVASGAVRELGRFRRSGCCISPLVTFSPRGDTFLVQRSGFFPTLFKADGSELRRLDGSDFFYDATGSWLLSRDLDGRTLQLFAELVETPGTRRQLTHDQSSYGIISAKISPDGSVLTYIRGRANSSSALRTLYAVRLVPEPASFLLVAFGFLGIATYQRV